MTIEIGLVQAFDGSARYGPAYTRDYAQAAEALGFHSVWVPEHIVFFEEYESEYPYPPEPGLDAHAEAARRQASGAVRPAC